MIASQEPDRKQFFQPIVETISLTLGRPVSVWLVDKTGQALRIAAAMGLPDDYIHKAVLHLDEPSVALHVFETGQTIVVPDIASDDRWKYRVEAAAVGLKSAMVVPLQVQKKIVGVLDVYTHEARDFSEFEKALIERFAAQIAITQRRMRDLAALNEVSLWINSELHPSELFRRITLSATRVLDCQHVSIFLVDKSGDLLLEVSSTEGIARTRFAPGVGLAGWVAQNKRPALVSDAVNDPRFVPGLSSDTAERSMLLVPIITGKNETIGVISADKDGLEGFDKDDQILLETLAGQAAVAVQNAQLFEQTTGRAAALRLLHQIGEQLLSAELSARGLKKVLRQVARSARIVLGADLVDVYQYVEAENRYILPPILEGRRRNPFVPKDHIFDDDVVVRVVKGGKPIYTPDAQTESLLSGPFTVERPQRPEKRFVMREGVLSSAATPLKVAGETVGVMFVNYRTRQAFTPDQREIVELFVNQAATAIYNTRLFQQTSDQAHALMRLSEVAQRLVSIQEAPESPRLLLEQIAKSAKEVLNADIVELYEYLQDREEYRLPQVSAGERRSSWVPKDKVYEDDVVFQLIQREEPLYVERVRDEPIFTGPYTVERTDRPRERYAIREELKSIAAIPLKAGRETVGLMFANFRTPQAFTVEQKRLIELFANQAAVAIHNYELNQQIARRVQALATLNEIGQTLTAGIRLKQDAILELIYEQARELTGAQDMYIALYDEETEVIRFGLATEHGERVHYEPRKADMEKRGKTEEVIFTREPILHRTLADSEAWYGQPGHQEFIGRVSPSWLGVPMVVGEKVLGMIAIYDWEREFAYDEQDLQVVSSMAGQTAIALDNATLYYETNQELKEANQELERLYEEARSEAIAAKQLATLGTAIAALQHRINNTFNIIVPNVTRLRKRVDMADETIVQILDIIERNARYTSDIIGRIQEPLREVEIQDVDVNAVLSDVVAKVREQWRADPARSTVEVILSLDDSIPQIRAPIGQVAEVFRNLVDNAHRAMKDGGQLTVTSRRTDSMIQVRVQDTGCGIPPAVQERLFVKPVPSKEPGGGAGLGLWLSRLMLQSIGGDVTIEKSGSTGTTMLVQIP